MSNGRLESWFPTLACTLYEVTSPASRQYNCAAWAAGRTDRRWWPDGGWDGYWPEYPRECSEEAFIRVFAAFGYEVCDAIELESGFEKIALYSDDSGPTHMARQLPCGLWTSKCGDFQDITHTLEGLEGTTYGRVTVLMKRRRPTRYAVP